MARIDGDDCELTDFDAALIKGMLKRGDAQHNIAAYFGVDSRAISHIKNAKTFVESPIAPATSLPPPGPYRPDPLYVSFYQEMVRVNQLWDVRRLKEAKAALEQALKSPVIHPEPNVVEQVANDLFRDKFGIMKDFGE